MTYAPYGANQPVTTCYRHPSQPAGIHCQRCGRPICPQCMVPAAVGFQCPECVKAGAKSMRSGIGPFGGAISTNPRITSFVLIGINALVWIALMLTGGANSRLFQLFGLIPLGRCEANGGRYFPNVTNAAECATVSGQWVAGVYSGAPWQLITSTFTHLAPLHLGANMLVLFMIGPQIEGVLGRARYLAVYFLSALGGSVVVCLLANPTSTTVGASGAGFGLLGSMLVLTLRAKANPSQVLMWLGLNVVVTFTAPNISWQGHFGGLLVGSAITAIMVYAPREGRARWQLIGTLAVTAALIAALVVRGIAIGS